MQDLARLGVLLGYDFAGLVLSQVREHGRAIAGLIHRYSSAVMIPSRPKIVLNQGTPAYGYGPASVRVAIMCKSAAERVSQPLKSGLLVQIAASPWRVSTVACRDSAIA